MYTVYGAADIPFEKPTEGRDAISPEAYTEFNAMLMDAKRAGVHLMLFISPSFNFHLLRSKKNTAGSRVCRNSLPVMIFRFMIFLKILVLLKKEKIFSPLGWQSTHPTINGRDDWSQ